MCNWHAKVTDFGRNLFVGCFANWDHELSSGRARGHPAIPIRVVWKLMGVMCAETYGLDCSGFWLPPQVNQKNTQQMYQYQTIDMSDIGSPVEREIDTATDVIRVPNVSIPF